MSRDVLAMNNTYLDHSMYSPVLRARLACAVSRDVLAMNNTYLDHSMSSPVLRARLACAVSRDVLAMNNTYLDHSMSSPVLRARLACAVSRDVLAMNNTYLDHSMSSPVLRARLACAGLQGCWASYRLLPAAAVHSAVTGYPTEPSVREVTLSYSGFTDGEAGVGGGGVAVDSYHPFVPLKVSMNTGVVTP